MCNNIRNVSIIAHVDHGKTTLADFLLASNNILSNKSAGKIRYLDSREDEQYRLITMKSSAVTLNWIYEEEIKIEAENGEYMINLIDSPGHVDFTYEVISSLRISDGSLLLIDVAEGIGDQTRKLLKHAYKERLKIILVLNKMDRLIIELGYNVKEAYIHISKLIEQVNVIIHQLIQEEIQELMLINDNIDIDYEDNNEKLLEFSFLNGNIVFTSCLHGWCLDINSGNILKNISNKLDLPWCLKTRNNLQKSISENYYYNVKTKKVSTISSKKDQLTMIEQFIFEPIWNIYNNIFIDFNKNRILKILKILNINSTEIENLIEEYLRIYVNKDYNNVDNINNVNNYLTSICKYIMSNWIPLSKGIFERIINYIPNPIKSNDLRFPFIYNNLYISDENYKDYKDLKIVYISKFSSCDLINNRLTKDRLKANEELNGFVGISRMFYGDLKIDDILYICNEFNNQKVKVISLYNLLGSDLIPINYIKTGDIFAICIEEINDIQDKEQNDKIIGKISCLDRTLTLSNYENFPSFNSLYELNLNSSLSSIIKVSIEPKRIQDLPLMLKGFELLSKLDPCVEIDTLDTGEYILGCHGEVHLERCISDLQYIFAQIPLTISKPLIAIREGLIQKINPNKINQNVCSHIPFPPWNGNFSSQNYQDQTQEQILISNQNNNNNKSSIPCNLATIEINAIPMSDNILNYIEKNQNFISNSIQHSNIIGNNSNSIEKLLEINQILINKLKDLNYEENDHILIGICIKKNSITLLISNDEILKYLNWSLITTYNSNYYPNLLDVSKDIIDLYRKIINGVIIGYELASISGPLCEEPMRGVIYILKKLKLNQIEKIDQLKLISNNFNDDIIHISESINLISNQLTTITKELCRKAFLQRGNVRIYEIYLNLVIFCEQNVLGKVYSVINKRRGSVYNEELKEGTSTFKIEAYIPIIESLGISQELRSKASGNISFHLNFSHWQLLDEDPFPESSMTIEEFEDEGFSKINLLMSIHNKYDHNLQYNIDNDNNNSHDINFNYGSNKNNNTIINNYNDDDDNNNKKINHLNNNINTARLIINSIRQRKGLPTQHKIVMAAEKQRTLNKKK